LAADQTQKTRWNKKHDDRGDPRRVTGDDMYRMRPHDVVRGPAVLGNSGLPVGGRWDEHHVAGFGEGPRVPAFRPGERG
jgi:hypothetical protein